MAKKLDKGWIIAIALVVLGFVVSVPKAGMYGTSVGFIAAMALGGPLIAYLYIAAKKKP